MLVVVLEGPCENLPMKIKPPVPAEKKPEDTPQQFDDVLRRMLSTPPDPKVKPKPAAKPEKKPNR